MCWLWFLVSGWLHFRCWFSAFGFRVSLSGGLLSLRPKVRMMERLQEVVEPGIPELRDDMGLKVGVMHGGPQFRGKNVGFAVGVGHIVRTLDATNESEIPTLSLVFRFLLEMLHTGTGRRTLVRAIKRVQPQT